MAVSYASDIRPKFTDRDIKDMSWRFDLSLYDDVVKNSHKILHRLERGDMPCYGPWPKTDVDLFREWINDGMKP
jgi:hypothetical protein